MLIDFNMATSLVEAKPSEFRHLHCSRKRMDNKRHNPSGNVPAANEPKGDLGEKGKTWSPGQEQGISNRPGDEREVGRVNEDDEFEEDDDSVEEEEGEGESDA
jgi:hypothetical protein